MATAAPTQNLPLFYNAIEPLNATQHGKMKVRTMLRMPQIAQTHAIPVTVDEFTLVQRHYPIVFSVGDNPIPIALFGLDEGVNVYLDEQRTAWSRFTFLHRDPIEREAPAPVGAAEAVSVRMLSPCRAVGVSFSRARAGVPAP